MLCEGLETVSEAKRSPFRTCPAISEGSVPGSDLGVILSRINGCETVLIGHAESTEWHQ